MNDALTLKRLDEPATETVTLRPLPRERGAEPEPSGEGLGVFLLKGVLFIGAATLASAVGGTVANYWWLRYQQGRAHLPGLPPHTPPQEQAVAKPDGKARPAKPPAPTAPATPPRSVF